MKCEETSYLPLESFCKGQGLIYHYIIMIIIYSFLQKAHQELFTIQKKIVSRTFYVVLPIKQRLLKIIARQLCVVKLVSADIFFLNRCKVIYARKLVKRPPQSLSIDLGKPQKKVLFLVE